MNLLLNEVITIERAELSFRVAEKHPNLSKLQFWSILEARNAKNEDLPLEKDLRIDELL